MSIVNGDLISDALKEIKVIRQTQSASAEQGKDGLRKLNQLMELLEEGGIRLEYFAQTTLSDPCPIPAYAELGITCSLAVMMAPVYGAKISPELQAKLQLSMGTIKLKAVQDQLEPATMVNRPMGSGWGFPWNILNGP